MPEPIEPPEFVAALREHLARDVSQAGFRPLTGADIRRAAAETGSRRTPLRGRVADAVPRIQAESARRSRSAVGWLAVAAALVVIVPGGLAIAHLLSRPVPAVPVPTMTAGPTAATPSADRPPVASWFRRVTAPVPVERYAQASIDGTVYLVAAAPDAGSCRLQGYRYDPAIDLWQTLPDGPEYPGECTRPVASARGQGVDVMVLDGGPRLYRYAIATSTWKSLGGPEDTAACDPIGLDAGVFCLLPTAGGGVGYQFYDAAGARWRHGILGLDPGELTAVTTAQRFELDGREVVLIVRTQGDGELLVVTWDPTSSSLTQPATHPGAGYPLTTVQTTSDGFAVFTSDAPDADTGVVLEPATGTWRTIEVPLAGGPLTHERPSDAGWVLRSFPETADRVVIGGYLYRPADDEWAAAEPL
ncbi:MAG: hypothetical protein KIT69_16455, partial [Propionibacteriaceae bacterium]|nr:hypothetical protein [Propionibacteriaceae bacterium]